MSSMVEITNKPIDPQAVTSKVLRESNGAVVTFMGTVRSHSQGKKVLHLEYETYPHMVLHKLEEVRAEIRQRWGVEDVAITHRVGHLNIGEVVVVIAIASPHRREAFEACAYAIERVKYIVPIWKKEVLEEGAHWVGLD